jgi:hypothetical protein
MAQVRGLGPMFVGIGYSAARLVCAPEKVGTACLMKILVIASTLACVPCSSRIAAHRVHSRLTSCCGLWCPQSPDISMFMPEGFDLSTLKVHQADVVSLCAAAPVLLPSLPVLASSACGRKPWSGAQPPPRYVAPSGWIASPRRYVTEGPRDSKETRQANQDAWWRAMVKQGLGQALAGKMLHIHHDSIPLNGRVGEGAGNRFSIGRCTLRPGVKLVDVLGPVGSKSFTFAFTPPNEVRPQQISVVLCERSKIGDPILQDEELARGGVRTTVRSAISGMSPSRGGLTTLRLWRRS